MSARAGTDPIAIVIAMLALSFLILVGTALIAEGLDFRVPHGCIYFAMALPVAVEMLNLRKCRA